MQILTHSQAAGGAIALPGLIVNQILRLLLTLTSAARLKHVAKSLPQRQLRLRIRLKTLNFHLLNQLIPLFLITPINAFRTDYLPLTIVVSPFSVRAGD